MRKKDCNITPFIQLSPRLNDQTLSGNGTKVLQRLRTTVRETDVQLDSHQRRAQGYRKYYRFGGDRIGHDVPSYDRNRIGIKDKRRKDVLARIGGSEGMCRMDNPLDSGQEDDTKSTLSEGQREQAKEHRGKGVSEWGRRVHECRQGGEYVERCLWGQERHHCQGQLSHRLNLWSLLQWGTTEWSKEEGRTV